MYISFNELSTKLELSEIRSQTQAREVINNFVIALKKIKEQECIEGILINTDIYFSKIISESEYGLREWLNDTSVDKEHKRFLKSYLGRSVSIFDDYALCGEFYVYKNESEYKGNGCTYAFEHEKYVISIETSSLWKKNIIKGKYIDIDREGEIVEIKDVINNLYDITSISDLGHKLIEKVYANISSGYDLWDQKEKLFPNLIFCDNVKAQLYNDPERYHIIAIMNKLKNLQDYFSKNIKYYDPQKLGMNARTESDTVKKDRELRKYRMFRLPNGREEYFYDHIGFSGKYSGGRIYFLPCVSENKCYIGYIGKHLPTKKF